VLHRDAGRSHTRLARVRQSSSGYGTRTANGARRSLRPARKPNFPSSSIPTAPSSTWRSIRPSWPP